MPFTTLHNVSLFFQILPQDWQEAILPFWNEYKTSTRCYVLTDENQNIIAGGLVFTQCPPDMVYAEEEANKWLNKGYEYLGFIYVIEERRKQNLGSIWLTQLKQMNPKQKYWLVIEEEKLDAFYVKNGFKYKKTLNLNDDNQEMLYSFEP